MSFQKQWYQKKISRIESDLGTNRTKGLTHNDAKERIQTYGKNIFVHEKKISNIKIFLRQIGSPLEIVLFFVAGISMYTREYIDGIVILGAIAIDIIIGFTIEQSAHKTISSLKKLEKLFADVIRNGKRIKIESEYLVPGDLIVVEAGSKVPADARVISAMNLRTNESSLTGESVAVRKNHRFIENETTLGSQKNMIHMGTYVVEGSGRAIVVKTGSQTSFGKIAKFLRTVKNEPTPLQRRLKKTSVVIGICALIGSFIVFSAGLLVGKDLQEMFQITVTAVVSVIPEGLSAAIVIVLAVGMKRILRKKAVVRQLIAAETLGSTNVICVDKTKTLTMGEMTVDTIFTFNNNERKLLEIAVLSSNSYIENPNESEKKWKVFGGSTEGSLAIAAAQKKIFKSNIEQIFPRLYEIPFHFKSRYSLSVNKDQKRKKIICNAKGAPEVILQKCNFYLDAGKVKSLTQTVRCEIDKKVHDFSKKGYRILSFAYREDDSYVKLKSCLQGEDGVLPNGIKNGKSEFEAYCSSELIFVGVVGIIDPIRKGIRETIHRCQKAGIRVVMITGDYRLTARTIARRIGLAIGGINILTGKELKDLNSQELKETLPKISVFARVTPFDKNDIIDAWQSKGAVVAMTGDGVNDAPALKSADIGIAMGSGSDVAKEASDMILIDDNFRTIVNAVEQGRVIFENIRKVLLYLFSTNIGEVIIVIVSLLVGLPLPLLPLHILWINLVTDGTGDIALAFEPEEKDTMSFPPLKKNANLVNSNMVWQAIYTAVVMFFGIFALFLLELNTTGSIEHARTIAFTTTSLASLFTLFSFRSLRQSMFLQNPFSNIFVILSFSFSILLQIAVVSIPFLQEVFKTTSLQLSDWINIVIISLIITFLAELRKFIWREHKKDEFVEK